MNTTLYILENTTANLLDNFNFNILNSQTAYWLIKNKLIYKKGDV